MKEIPEAHRMYRSWSYDSNIDEAYIDDDAREHDGYVYRIDGGWRLTNKDHDAIDDPYIVRKVMEQLRGNTPVAESPNDYNFEKLHYGQPLPMKGI